jgi:hypothetical protein
MTMYKLYAIDAYNKKEEFIKNEYKEYNLKNLIRELKNDNGYHMRISSDQNYIFFGDCDHFKGSFPEFAELLIDFLKDHYEGVDGSFHYSIPNFYTSCKKLKEIHEKFYQKHIDIFHYIIDGKVQKVVDISIYANKWFRYPQQRKEKNKNVKHIIKKGKMKDFVVEYIPKKSVCIDDKEYMKFCKPHNNLELVVRKKSNDMNKVDEDNNNDNDNDCIDSRKLGNLFTKTLKKERLNLLSNDENIEEQTIQEFEDNIDSSFKRKLLEEILSGINTYDDYKEWTNVGMALKNESCDDKEFFDLWDEWSRNSIEKYDGTNDNKKKWKSFKKMNGYSMHYLLSLLKSYDPEKYGKIHICTDVQKFIKNNKRHYPNNECAIDDMNQFDQKYEVSFVDKYCPICDDEHSEADDHRDHRFFEITDRGTAGMKCTNQKCYGKMCPIGGIPVPKNMTNMIFVVNNNYTNNGVINNNINSFEPDFDLRFVLETANAKIFNDDTMNKHVINSLSGDADDVVDAIMYTNKKDICVVNNEWYIFENNSWKQNNDIVKDMILEFIMLYKIVKESIKELKEIYGIEKNAYVKQVDKLIVSVKKNKDIPKFLAKKLTRENKFDLNMNLMGFTNGVYDFEKMEFRKGLPTDMIKKSCGYDYVVEYENKQNMIDILLKIFPDKKSMDFFLTYIAISMCGKNNSNLMAILKWSNVCYRDTLMRILSSTFGDYYCSIDELSTIVTSENKSLTDLTYLKIIRIVIIETVKNIITNDISKLIVVKQLKHRTKEKVIENIEVHFSTLCMCEKNPIIDENILKNTAMIVSSNGEYEDIELNKNDFFLLLIEYLKKFKEGSVKLDKKLIEIDERSEETKICEMFMKDCIKKSKGNEKSTDVYNRYIEWSNKKNYELQLTNKQLFAELRNVGLCYKKTVRFLNKFSPAFTEITIIHDDLN